MSFCIVPFEDEDDEDDVVVVTGWERREEEENVADGLDENVADGLDEKVADFDEDDLEVRGVRIRMGASSGPTPLDTIPGLAGV